MDVACYSTLRMQHYNNNDSLISGCRVQHTTEQALTILERGCFNGWECPRCHGDDVTVADKLICHDREVVVLCTYFPTISYCYCFFLVRLRRILRNLFSFDIWLQWKLQGFNCGLL